MDIIMFYQFLISYFFSSIGLLEVGIQGVVLAI